MTALAKNQLLRRGVLLFLLALNGCATVGDKATVGDGAAAAAPATSPAATRTVEEPEPAKPENTKMFKGTGILAKAPEPDRESTDPGEVSFNFEGADVREVAKTVLADVLGEAYMVDPAVQGTISFRSSRPLPRSALLPTLETVLRMNGIVIVKENNIFKILPANAVRGSLSPKMGLVPGYSVQVVPLQYIGSREMARILEPFAPDSSAIKADELRNFVIIAGTQNEIRHMLDTVAMFDVDWLSGMSVGLFTLQNTDVKTIDAELSKILSDPESNPLAGAVRLIPMERLNGFIVITPQPHYLEQAKLWLERLDRTGGAGGGERLYVYHVQNGKAEHLADLLNQTFGGGATTTTRTTTAPSLAPGLAPTDIRSTGPMSTPSTTTTTTTQGLLGGTTGGTLGARTGSSLGTTLGSTTARTPAATATTRPAVTGAPVTGTTLSVAGDSGVPEAGVRVVADKENNALVILATPAAYDKILAAVKKLDLAPRQVLIEAALVEVTLTGELSYGTEWLFTNGPRKSGQLDTGSPGLNKLVPGFSYAITAAGSDQIKAVLNMFATDNRANLLASPHIMVTDNQTARIQVGDSVPTAGPQTVTNQTVVTSVQYVETGVLLSVTPRINAGGLVNLEINQEVSTAVPTETSGLDSPTISKRTAQTSLAVQSGETVVMGGLIRDNSSSGSSGLPFLSSIPVLGGLFGTQSRTSSKVELVLLITPRVAENAAEAKLLSDEFRTKMRQAEELRKCGTSNVFGYTSRGGLWCLEADKDGAKTGQQTEQ